jgi:hypothetical protein
MEDTKRAALDAGLLEDNGAVVGIEVRNGRAYPGSKSLADLAGAAGLQAYFDGGHEGNPTLFVYRAIRDAGVRELGGVIVAEAVAEMEAEEAAHGEEDADDEICQAAAAAIMSAFAIVMDTIEAVGTSCVSVGDLTGAMEAARITNELEPYALGAFERYEGPPLSWSIVHEIFREAGFDCSETSVDDEEDTSYRNGDRYTGNGRYQA